MNSKCISCGRKIKLFEENSGIKIYRCPKCGLGVTEHTKEKDQYAAYHRDPVYLRESAQFRNIFEKRVNIISKFKNVGKALEIGSSTGLLLLLLKERGWEIMGIDPSRSSVSEARRREIPTLNTTFEQANLGQLKFDVIIFNHVFEHMANPLEVLKKANKLLKKGGIVFFDVPNFASLSARISGAAWRYILPKEHRWHFTPTALFMLLEKARFTPVYWEAHSGVWGYDNPIRELWESLRGGKKRFVWNILTLMPTWFLTQFKSGTGLSVVAQKL